MENFLICLLSAAVDANGPKRNKDNSNRKTSNTSINSNNNNNHNNNSNNFNFNLNNRTANLSNDLPKKNIFKCLWKRTKRISSSKQLTPTIANRFQHKSSIIHNTLTTKTITSHVLTHIFIENSKINKKSPGIFDQKRKFS